MTVLEWLDISWEYHHGGVTAESSAEASALKGNVGSTNLKKEMNLDSFAIWVLYTLCILSPAVLCQESGARKRGHR